MKDGNKCFNPRSQAPPNIPWLAARIDFMYPFSDETLALPDQHWTNSRPGCLRAPGKFRLNFA